MPSLLVVRLLRLCKYIHTFLNFKTTSTPTKHIRHVRPCYHPCPRRGLQGSRHFPEKLDGAQSLIDSSFYRRNSNLSSSKSMSLSTSDNGGIHARYLPYIIGKPRPSSKLPSTSSPTPVSPSRKKSIFALLTVHFQVGTRTLIFNIFMLGSNRKGLTYQSTAVSPVVLAPSFQSV